MSETYDNTNSGALRKKTSEKWTEYLNGKVNVDGKDYWVSVFKNTKKTEDKQPDYNVSVKSVEETTAPAKSDF